MKGRVGAFEKISKIDKPIVKLTSRRKEKIKLIQLEMERGHDNRH
jgi:hypothetical protein